MNLDSHTFNHPTVEQVETSWTKGQGFNHVRLNRVCFWGSFPLAVLWCPLLGTWENG